MRLAKVIGGIGRVLIWAGAIILLFVAYQLWGTNLAEARAQGSLEDEFAEQLAQVTTTTAPEEVTTTTSPRPTTTTTTTPPPPPDDGEAAARIVIPKIGVDKIVVEGVSRDDLQRGPGHYPQTPLPGQAGNAAIAGHRTTFGAPFNRVDELEVGDEILVTTLQGTFTYEVSGLEIVSPSQVDVIEDKGDDRLTLTSCHPKFSARQRIIVSALLVDDPAPTSPTPTTIPVDDVDEIPGDDLPGEDTPEPEPEPETVQDLESLDAGERRTAGPAVGWGAFAAFVWLAFYVLSKRWRRWPAYAIGAVPFGISLFVFFGAFSDLLPANF